jgi:hypothetical protein
MREIFRVALPEPHPGLQEKTHLGFRGARL